MTLEEEVVNLWFAEVEDESGEEVDMTVGRISHETGMSIPKVRQIIFGEDETGTDTSCPYYLKQYHKDVLPVKKYQELKGHLILKAEATALATLQKMLAKFAANPPDTVGEAKDLMGMIAQLDKITRLEDGKPTEIIKSTNYTPQRIIQIIESDPMYGGRKKSYGEEKEESEENKPRRLGTDTNSGSGSDEKKDERDRKEADSE